MWVGPDAGPEQSSSPSASHLSCLGPSRSFWTLCEPASLNCEPGSRVEVVLSLNISVPLPHHVTSPRFRFLTSKAEKTVPTSQVIHEH